MAAAVGDGWNIGDLVVRRWARPLAPQGMIILLELERNSRRALVAWDSGYSTYCPLRDLVVVPV